MENNKENRDIFMAQNLYSVIEIDGITQILTTHALYQLWLNGKDKKATITKKPLSSITDEDFLSAGISKGKRKQYICFPYQMTPLIDQILRSKGYALPWLGLSVENQIEYGWIKLIEG